MADTTTPYIAPALKDQGYTGASGTTPYKPANTDQVGALRGIATNTAITDAPRTVSTSATVLNINFDGTKNNGQYPAGGEQPTNVFELTKLQREAGDAKNTLYYPGVGAQTAPSDAKLENGNPAPGSSSSNWDSIPSNAGKVATGILDQAYIDLTKRVGAILDQNPNAEISINLSGFSRGGAEAVAFANLIKERGLPGVPDGKVSIDTMVLFDPVSQTNGQLNTTWPTNVRNNVVFVAENETRDIMRAMPLGEGAKVVAVPGDHCDIGGSHTKQGISAVTLDAARKFQEASGVPVAEIPPEKRPDFGQMNVHNTGLDNYGNVVWKFDENGKRYYEGTGLGSGTVQDALKGRATSVGGGDGKSTAVSDDYTVPADPAKPSGAQLRLREVRDETGAVHLEVRDTDGQLVLQTKPGERLVRDDATGKLTVADSDGNESGSYTAPAQADTGAADTFTAFLTTGPGSHLSPTQQDALAAQLDNLGLGGGNDLSFHTLPDGSVIIANRDGERVGGIQISDSGDVHLNANSVESDGTAGQHDVVIAGDTTTDADTTTATTTPDVIPVTHREVEIGGFTYTVNANGTLNRDIPGQPDLVESRDSTGAGIIFDGDGNAVAILQPGDCVGMTDDGRIAISDSNGHSVNRQTEDAPANTFATATGDTGNASTSNKPQALADTGTIAPETVATGPDGSDNRFTRYPVPPPNLAPLTDSLTLVNTVLNLKNWGSQDSLGRLSTAVNLYNQVYRVAGVDGPLGDLGTFGSGLGVISALKSGNPISVASSGATFYNSIVGSGSVNAIPIPVINGLNLINAIQSGNPLSIASSAAAFIPVYGPLISIGISVIGSLFGSNSPPPPPEGSVHYTWDETGAITIQTDQNVSGGGDTAHGTAGNVLGLMQSLVASNNHDNDAKGQSQANLAIDPSRLPRVGHTAGMSWIEITHPDGHTTKEALDPANAGEQLLRAAVINDALAPQWQIDTAQAHAQTVRAQQQQAQAEQEPQVSNTQAIDGQASAPPAAKTPTDIIHDTAVFGVAGKAVESADHKSQNYDALVVHLRNPQVQAHVDALAAAATTTDATKTDDTAPDVLRDVDGDGYFETTQWVATQDTSGRAQGVLVLDRNNNGLIETNDILQLGGSGNEHNSLAWLDANGDGKLDARDPAFAAIKVWVDCNHNGQVDAGEGSSLQDEQLGSIDFRDGTIHYTDGQSDALSATTLKADTEGVKLDTVKVVGADGKLQELDAGTLIVHEGYDGKTRTNSYELQAKSIGDWEGTAEQDQHRHGGGNMTGAPTQTRASSAGSLGAVLGRDNVTTQTTMDAGDRRITSDAPALATGSNKPATGNATLTLNAGDARITSNTPVPKPVVFVPPAAGTLGLDDADEDGWIHIPGDGLFGKGGVNAALTAVALGSVQTTAYAMADPKDSGFAWQTAGPQQNTSPAGSGTHALPVGEGGAATDQPGSTITLENFAVVHQMRLGVVAPLAPPPTPVGVWTTTSAPQVIVPVQGGGVAHAGIRHYTTTDTAPVPVGFVSTTPATLYIAPGHTNTNTNPQTNTPGNTTPVPSDSTPTAPGASATPPAAPATPTPQAPIDTTPTAPTLNSATTANDLLSDPQEEAVLHVSVATLLANDTNAVGIAQSRCRAARSSLRPRPTTMGRPALRMWSLGRMAVARPVWPASPSPPSTTCPSPWARRATPARTAR